VSAKLQQVHVRVNDAAIGKPTPCRVRFTDAEGNYYPPNGRLAKFAAGPNQDVGGNVYIGVKPHAYIDGTCEISLPPGLVHVEISKGPEYKPLHADVQLAAGKLSMRFTLERWIDLREQGWYSGDTRALFLSPHAALLEAQAEDLAVVNLLAAESVLKDAFGESVRAIPNLLAFSGQDFGLSVQGHGVAVNTLNRHAVLGTLALLHCHRVVYPLTFGGPAAPDDWALADWCDQCHRKGGLVVWANTAEQLIECGKGEALADLILGKIDAFELDHYDGSPFDSFPDWTRLLNAGIKATLVGASGKQSNGRALGVMRTYAHLQANEPLTYGVWIEAVRAGRTFATNGPLVSLAVNGAEPSTNNLRADADETLSIQAEARSWVPFDRLVICVNGLAVESAGPSSGPPYSARLDVTRPVGDSTWVTACCLGDAQIADRPAAQRVFAGTSPVYLQGVGRANTPRQREEAKRLLDELATGLRWVSERATCRTDRDRERLVKVFVDAKHVLLRKLEH
jgi:hypothetical protein